VSRSRAFSGVVVLAALDADPSGAIVVMAVDRADAGAGLSSDSTPTSTEPQPEIVASAHRQSCAEP